MVSDFEFTSQPVIETTRLLLRKPAMSDAGQIAESLNDFDVAKMLVRVPWPYALDGAIWWINHWLEGRQNGWCFAINEKAQLDKLIGVVTVEPNGTSQEMGWWLNRSVWHKGYMTEAVSAVLHHARLAQPDVVLTAGAIVDNPASRRIQEKLGFKVTGQEQVNCVSRNMLVDVIKTRYSGMPEMSHVSRS